MAGKEPIVDRRLTGTTAENIFLSLVNQEGVFATSFDTEAFDGIAFDPDNKLFKVGESPFFVQIKCRGSRTDRYNARNFPSDGIRKIEVFAENLGVSLDSVYFVVGFYRDNDVRTIQFFGIPFSSLDRFKTDRWYNFSAKRCRAASDGDDNIFSFVREEPQATTGP